MFQARTGLPGHFACALVCRAKDKLNRFKPERASPAFSPVWNTVFPQDPLQFQARTGCQILRDGTREQARGRYLCKGVYPISISFTSADKAFSPSLSNVSIKLTQVYFPHSAHFSSSI